MNTEKKIAGIIGFLFVITMIAGMVDAYFIAPVLGTSLDNIYRSRTEAITGAILILIMSVGIVSIAVMLLPILRKFSETIAVTYVSFRTVECVLLMVGAIVYLFLITLGREYTHAGGQNAAFFQTIAALAVSVRYSTYQIAMIVLGIGSILLCYVLFKSKLVPGFISIWGIAGYTLLLVSALLDLVGVIDTVHGKGAIMYAPGGLWEFVIFPAWLFIRGFNAPAIEDVNA